MQRNILKERHPNILNVPILGFKPDRGLNTIPISQPQDVVVTPLNTAASEGVANSSLPRPQSLEKVDVGYRADSEGHKSTAEEMEVASETPDQDTAPKTPLKTAKQTGTPPLTPLANLKVLIAAASTAMEKQQEGVAREEEGMEPDKLEGVEPTREGAGLKREALQEVKVEIEDVGGRKMKSLAVLCKKFLSIADSDIGVGTDFSLESMCKKLGTNRRRIYDIINVLEALEMIVKQSKNWYTWLGQESLLLTLAKMRAMAEDDLDFRHLLYRENSVEDQHNSKENQPPPSSSSSSSSSTTPPTATPTSTGDLAVLEAACKLEDPVCYPGVGGGAAEEVSCILPGAVGPTGGGRWDKSLGVLCQKFIMLFLVTPNNEVTLDYAGNILMPDDGSFPLQPTNPKTKVRRLYDIANVLTTLGLIRKKTFLAPNHRKMPGYSWAGPSLEQIQAISVSRKSEPAIYSFCSKKKGSGGVPLARKPSFGSLRPFLHQYEVKGQGRAISCGPNSAPSSPTKMKGAGFKRSLSFGANSQKMPLKVPPLPLPNILQHSAGEGAPEGVAMCATPIPHIPAAKSSKCVVARQVNPVQMDYLQEVREFEAEIQRHSHKYPHVAPIFTEFINKFLSTLEQSTAAIQMDTTPPVSVTPSPLGSPPFHQISPSKLANNFFPPSISPVAMSAPPTPASSLVPAVSATPSLSAPPTTAQSQDTNCAQPVMRMQNGSVASVMGSTSRAINSNSVAINSSGVAINSRNVAINSTAEMNGFNPSSLLVNVANGGYSLFPSAPYLPLSCYSLSSASPSTSAVLSGIKMASRSLAPKPTTTPPNEDREGDKENISPSKRLRLENSVSN